MIFDKDIVYYRDRLERLKQKRNPYEKKWRELAIFCDPKNMYFRLEKPGGLIGKRLIPKTDDTAQLNLPLYAAVLSSMLTPQAYIWHKLRFYKDEMQTKFGYALDEQNKMLFNLRYSAYSNFPAAMNEFYMSGGVFGHAVMEVIPNWKRKRIGYRTLPIEEFYIDKDVFGYIDTYYRDVNMPMRQVKQLFPDYMPEKYKDRKDWKWLEDEVEIVHAVEPSCKKDDYWTETWIDVSNQCIIETKDLDYCRYHAYRTAVFPSSDDPYGFSPCMTILPSIKALNSLQFNFLKQTDLAGQPTLLTNSDIIDASKVTANGSVIEGGIDDEGRAMVQALRTYGELPPMDYEIQHLEAKIKQALLVNYLATFSETQSRSATDSMIKANEKANLVAPCGDKLAREFILPLIETEIVIYHKMGVLPQMPAETKGEEFDIVLDNPLLKGQRMDSVNNATTLMQYITQLAGVDPSAIDNVNVNRLIKYLQENMNVPSTVMNTPDEIQAQADAKAQQAEMMAVMQNAQGMGSAVKDIAQAQAIAGENNG